VEGGDTNYTIVRLIYRQEVEFEDDRWRW